MTMEELDCGLRKIGLNLDCDAGQKSKDRILDLFGQHMLNSKKDRCENCWYREKGKCNSNCELNFESSNTVEVAKSYISHPNDLNLVSFICLFAIPIYEDETGSRGTMQSIADSIKSRMKKYNSNRGLKSITI